MTLHNPNKLLDGSLKKLGFIDEPIITYWNNMRDVKKPKHIKISEAFNRIKTANNGDLLPLFAQMRAKGIDEEEYGKLKRRLPVYSFAGKFAYRNNSSCEKYEGFITIDLDNLPGQGFKLETVKQQLCQDPYTFACFISPGGDGLKVLVRLPIDPDSHTTRYLSLESYYKQSYNLTTDRACKDISRLCFDSYDPEIYINWESRLFEDIEAKPEQTQATSTIQTSEIINEITAEQMGTIIDPEKVFFESLRAANERIKQAVINGESFEVPVLIYRNDEPFFNSNTINAVVAASGSLKSTFLNTIMAVMLNKGSGNYDFLGFTVNEEFGSKLRIFLFDTEQSENKVNQRVASIVKAAGFNNKDYPGNLFVYPLSASSTKERILAVTQILDRLFESENNKLHNIIFLDVVTDLTKDINDSKEAPDIVAQLQQLVNLKNVTIFISIHKAKTTGTARGHIGTEVTNKATTILAITRLNSSGIKKGNEGNGTVIYKMQTEKYREGKEQNSFEFTYNEENNLLRLATSEEKEQLQLKEKDQMRLLYESFGFNKFTVTNDTREIEPKLVNIFGEKKERSYNFGLDKLCEFDKVTLMDNGTPLNIKLQKGKIGRKICYQVYEVYGIFENEVNDH